MNTDEFNKVAKTQESLGKDIATITDDLRNNTACRTRQQVATIKAQLNEIWIKILTNDNQCKNFNMPDHSYNKSGYFDKLKIKYDEANKLATTLTTSTGNTASTMDPRIRRLQIRIDALESEIQAARLALNASPEKICIGHWKSRLSPYWSPVEELHFELLEDSEASKNYEPIQHANIKKEFYDVMHELDSMQEGTGHQASTQRTSVKLPRVTIPTFEGGFSHWAEFQDIFTKVIHDNQTLSNVEKLQLLKQHTKGEASKLLQHLSLTGDNYTSAWDLLKERFNNKRIIMSKLIDKILDQPNCNTESARQLRHLHDTTNECLLSIKNLGYNSDVWGAALISRIIARKWDKETNRVYEQDLENPREPQTLDNVLTFLEKRFQSLDGIANTHNNVASTTNNYNTASNNHLWRNQASRNKCFACDGQHSIFACLRFRNMSTPDRNKLTKKNQVCVNCLTHSTSTQCHAQTRCRTCNGFHHSLLHIEQRGQAPNQNKQGGPNNYKPKNHSYVSESSEHKARNEEGLLPTAMVNVATINGFNYLARCLLDQGSQTSFITEDAAQRLGLPKQKIRAEISGLADGEPKIAKWKVSVKLQPRFSSNFVLQAELIVMPKLTGNLPSSALPLETSQTWRDQLLADPNFAQPGKIDIILGAAEYSQLIKQGLQRKNGYISQDTELGMVISGGRNLSHTAQTYVVTETNDLKDLSRFWELEDITQSKRALTLENEICELYYNDTTRKNIDGSYTVRLPFKETPPQLGLSKQRAAARFTQLERRLNKDSQLKEMYHAFIKEYIDLKHMQLCRKQDAEVAAYYIPHHAVLKTSSSTTKLRVVFDASCKTSNGFSLNDKLYVGPQLQGNIVDILLRWRKHQIVFTADVEKMFRQIWINKDDQQYQRILWRFDPRQPVQEYQLTTVTYGMGPASYLAVKTLQQIANDAAEQYPKATAAILNDFYVDDALSGANNLEDAIQLQKDLIKVLKKGGLNLRKWSSNVSELISGLPEEMVDQSAYELKDGESKKSLGIKWDPKNDTFSFRIITNNINKFTKRSILSEASKLYDPMGWLAPVVIKAKLIIQDLWINESGWDAPIPIQIEREWVQLCQELPALEQIQIKRWMEYYTDIELHGFCDASEKAYGAVVYSKAKLNGKTTITLLQAKSKVAPIKTKATLPRLELCAAQLLAKLINNVKTALQTNITATHAWSDSMITLAWIQGEANKWKTFVSNRVADIQQRSKNITWRHVRTDDNPADAISRGLRPSVFVENTLWWKGPAWLSQEEVKWPSQPVVHATTEQTKRAYLATVTTNDCINRFSNLTRLLHVLSYCRRMKKRQQQNHITTVEMEETLRGVLKYTQEKDFREEHRALQQQRQIHKSSRIATLAPFLDKTGIIRVGGRLDKSTLEFEQRHPIIVPPSTHLSKLLIRDAHQKTMHGGVEATVAYLRRKYWIPQLKKSARAVVKECTICIRFKSATARQEMGQLPKERVTPSRAFTHTGVDYAGPIDVRTTKGRGHKTYKGYIALFVCLATKAIHLEVVSDMTTNTFLAALRRFSARRGRPNHIYSDNGTTFVGADRFLKKEVMRLIESTEVQGETANMGIDWHFIPAASPHFGGLWEAGVKSMKYHLRRQLGKASLTYEELSTLMCQIEACLNSRPLCSTNSNNVDEPNVLTPAHFIVGQAIIEPGNALEEKINASCSERWVLIQKKKQEFWKIWSSEYLTRLQHRYKWTESQENLKVGAVVIMKNSHINPSNWPLAKITDIHPGNDGKVRVVTLQGPQGGIYKRAITNLIPLPEDIDNSLQQEPKPVAKVKVNYASSNNSKNKLKHNNTFNASILWSTIILVLCAASVKANVTIHQVRDAVYVEHIGSVYLNQGELRIQLAFNKEKIQRDIEAAQLLSVHFLNACNASVAYKHDIGCAALQHHLDFETNKMETILQSIRGINATKPSREKRGLMGTVLTSIFGVNDEVYRDIDQLDVNQQQIIKEAGQQGRIMISTLNIVKQTEEKIRQQMEGFQQQLQGTLRTLDNVESANQVYTRILSVYQQALNCISEVNDYYGKVIRAGLNKATFFDLIEPGQVAASANSAAQHLAPHVQILDKVLTRTEYTDNKTHVNIYGYFPIINSASYSLLKVNAIPIKITSESYTSLDVTDNFLAINYNQQRYMEISPEEFRNCLTIGKINYTCPVHPVKRLDMQAHCLIEAVYNNLEPCHHQLHTYQLDSIRWKQLLTPNTWLFITHKNVSVAVICREERTNILLNQAGIITISQDCYLETKLHLLLPNQGTNIQIKESYVHSLNTSLQDYDPSKRNYHTNTKERVVHQSADPFSNLLEEEANLTETYKETVWKQVNPQNNHGTFLLGVTSTLALGAILVIVYQCKKRKPSTPQKNLGDIQLDTMKDGRKHEPEIIQLEEP